MKMKWDRFIGKLVNVTMKENYGVVYGNENSEQPQFYEIVFKSGKLIEVHDDSLLLESERENTPVFTYIPFSSIKCIDIFEIQGN